MVRSGIFLASAIHLLTSSRYRNLILHLPIFLLRNKPHPQSHITGTSSVFLSAPVQGLTKPDSPRMRTFSQSKFLTQARLTSLSHIYRLQQILSSLLACRMMLDLRQAHQRTLNQRQTHGLSELTLPHFDTLVFRHMPGDAEGVGPPVSPENTV